MLHSFYFLSFFITVGKNILKMNKQLIEAQSIGIIGGGQLAMMMLPAARRFGLKVVILDPDKDCSAGKKADRHIVGEFDDDASIDELVQTTDIITYEIEKIEVSRLIEAENTGKIIRPSSKILGWIQDKFVQKGKLQELGLPISKYSLGSNLNTEDVVFPCVWKARRDGYDGKGVFIVRNRVDVNMLPPQPGYFEELVNIKSELAVVGARSVSGEVKIYPITEIQMDPEKNLMNRVVAPANLSRQVSKRCKSIARDFLEKTRYVGVMAIEFFLTTDNELFVNEVSPRPHNSGHYTIEACVTSQFEQHIRCVLDLPLGSVNLNEPAVTFNLIGAADIKGQPTIVGLDKFANSRNIFIHNYGKKTIREGRKMGHVTVIGDSRKDAVRQSLEVQSMIKVEVLP